MKKADLRTIFLEKRVQLSRSDYWELTESLMNEIRQHDWNRFKVVHLFLPISNNKEIDTFSLIELFKEEYPKTTLLIPRTDFNNQTMENVVFDPESTVLFRNKFNIPEPIFGKIMDPQDIDLVFLPLLAFDHFGNRVGYGKGFYDRLLEKCRPDIFKVGLSYFEPVEMISDCGVWDVKMDLCIGPGQTWIFSHDDDSGPL